MVESTIHPWQPVDVSWLLRVPIDPMTYRSLAYLVVSIPLGLLYLPMLLTGFALSVGLSIVLIGPFVLVITLLLIVGCGWLEAALAEALLDAEVDPVFPSNDSVADFFRDLFLAQGTWLSLLFLLWKICLAFLALIGLVVSWSIAVSFLLAPFFYGDYLVVQSWTTVYAVDSFSTAMALALVGVLVLYLTLLAANVLGHLCRIIAEGLLVHQE